MLQLPLKREDLGTLIEAVRNFKRSPNYCIEVPLSYEVPKKKYPSVHLVVQLERKAYNKVRSWKGQMELPNSVSGELVNVGRSDGSDVISIKTLIENYETYRLNQDNLRIYVSPSDSEELTVEQLAWLGEHRFEILWEDEEKTKTEYVSYQVNKEGAIRIKRGTMGVDAEMLSENLSYGYRTLMEEKPEVLKASAMTAYLDVGPSVRVNLNMKTFVGQE